jgi:hypothetical protein
MSAPEALDNRAAQAPPMHVYRRGQHKGGCSKDNAERLPTVHIVFSSALEHQQLRHNVQCKDMGRQATVTTI